jgi:acid phosphatase (class A)
MVAGAFAALLLSASGAFAFDEWMDAVAPEKILGPPPARGSAVEKAEVEEILKAHANASPAAMAQAKADNDVEDPTIFASVIGPGWNLTKLPKTEFLMERVMQEDRRESRLSKHYFHRPRPWIVDARVQTCAPHETGPAENSYPSGHTMLGYEVGTVLAALMPGHAPAIMARAAQYGENRIVCGFHFRSDVVAGKTFGTAVAQAMMKNPAFHGWFVEAQAELKTAGLAR